MGIFGRLFGKKSPETVTTTVTLDAQTSTRNIQSDAVTALDDALAQVANNRNVMHAMDPRRILAFASGGPAAWSVAHVPLPGEQYLLVTYGLSRMIDAAPSQANIGYELSLRMKGHDPMWATLLLRQCARYIMTSGKDLEVGHVIPFDGPITRAALAPEHRDSMPTTPLEAVCLVADPDLRSVATARGPIEVRRLYGVHPCELQAMAPERSAIPFAARTAPRDPTFTTILDRPPWE